MKGIEFDTMIAAHLLNPTARPSKLDTLGLEHFNYEMVPIEELVGKGRNQTTLDKVSLEKTAFYSIENADIAFQLTELFKTRLKEAELYDFFSTIEVPLIKRATLPSRVSRIAANPIAITAIE